MSKLKHLLAVFAAIAIILSSQAAHATHFRYGNITYTIPDRSHPRTVRFEVIGGWRIDYTGGFQTVLNFGDGSSNPGTEGFLLGTGFDASGLQYKYLKYVTTHTYPSNGQDQFTASYTSCCRLSNLIGGHDASFLITAKVDLGLGNTGNPRSLIPAIIQLQTGGPREHFIPAADPDGTPISCRFSTPTETGDSSVLMPPLIYFPAPTYDGFGTPQIPTNPTRTTPPTLTPSASPPGCKLSWNTTDGVPGQQYAIQVQLETINPNNGKINSAVVDYIIEFVQAPVPTCTGGGEFTIPMGTHFKTNLVGTNSAGGGGLMISEIYSNGAILPVTGTVKPSPFTASFDWTPGLGEDGTFLATVIYTDQKNVSGFCSLTLKVPSCPQYGQACTVGVGQCQSKGILKCDGTNVVCSAVAGQPKPEVCDNIDNNCDGQVDEGNPESGVGCTTGLSGVCATGLSNCAANGVLECVPNVVPGAVQETCNGLDDDCNGTVDDNFKIGKDCSVGLGICKKSSKFICDDQGGAICNATPGSPKEETCNGLDDNCDGNVDENFGLGADCSIGKGACLSTGVVVCDINHNTVCNALPLSPQAEICGNDVDEDCDGALNNGCKDSDGDGLYDSIEEAIGTDPHDADSDDDGVMDGAEPSYDKDTDGDGLINALDPDSDNDGLFDGTEMGLGCGAVGTDQKRGHCRADADEGATKTDPLKADSDGSGVIDGSEDTNLNGRVDADEADPNNAGDDKSVVDTDFDGLSDKLEEFLGTNPKDADSDDDGVVDGDEPNFADDTDGDGLINALDVDSDNDGLLDGTELGHTCQDPDTNAQRGHCRADGNHGVTTTCMLKADTDGDGATDGSEDANLNGVVDPGEQDPNNASDGGEVKDADGDGLSDALEQTLGSSPNDVDSDDDGLRDGLEPNPSDDQDGDGKLNVLDSDSDNDKLFDGLEAGHACDDPHTDKSVKQCVVDGDAGSTKTSVLKADSDGGGTVDGDEDENHNGVVDNGERNPEDASDDIRAAECTKDADCSGAASGRACEKNKCVMGCRTDAMCSAGQVCSEHSGKLGTCKKGEEMETSGGGETMGTGGDCSCGAVGRTSESLGWLVFATGAVFAALRRRRDQDEPS